MTGPRDWIEFARQDLEVAELTLEKRIYNLSCFHAQQGIEKALKAFLKTHQAVIPKIHGLGELVSLCRNYDDGFSELEDTCAKLDPYYIPTRYPDIFPGAGPGGPSTQRQADLRDALRWIENKLK